LSETGLIPAVVLAGGTVKPEIARMTGVSNRALIPIGGRTMLECVVDALHGSGLISEIIVVGDLPVSPEYRSVSDQGDFVGNLFGGIEAAGKAEYVLVTTVDVPFVTGEVIEDFVREARMLGSDVAYPVVPVEKCYERFPGVKRTAIGLREGRFTGGNMMLTRPDFLISHRERIASGYAARKAPLKLAMMLGIGTVARLVLSLAGIRSALNLPVLERAAGRLLGGTARAYISPYPEIATDIDRPGDLEAIAARGARGSAE
jgi:GTP:adenosylcobinamide-phosphate guanylyltransferase